MFYGEFYPKAVFYGELAKGKRLHGGQWLRYKGKSHIEEKLSQKYQHDHNLRHGFPDASAPIIFCVNCGRGFKSQIGLFYHQRAKHVTDETLH